MKITAVSDLHGNLPEIPQTDILVICGDICPVRDHSIPRQLTWLDNEFRNWLKSVPAKTIIGVAGNHDFCFQEAPEHIPHDLNWVYLQDKEHSFEGINFYGTPWQPWFHDWAFNSPELQPDKNDFLRKKWSEIPNDTNVLITHGPPYGILDLATRDNRTGCPLLRDRTFQLKDSLKFHFFGHIHEAYGIQTNNGITYANVASVDERYVLRPKPFVEFEFE